ncbi:hypothetical protein HY839_03575 [Candidatus Azambacteria bacterium]|nr:hypothetical protein [Candidatus Azambacteria bacterium]
MSVWDAIKDAFVQCFILLGCFFAWKVQPGTKNELRSAQVILAQSFGLRGDKPGISNEALTKVVADLWRCYHLPLVLQWEIADCLPGVHKAGVIRRHRTEGEYLDTHEVLAQSREICKKGWTKAIVVAHPDHMWRVVRVAENVGFHAIPADVQDIPYDPQSSQSWTRSKMCFIPREIAARLLYFMKGWL